MVKRRYYLFPYDKLARGGMTSLVVLPMIMRAMIDKNNKIAVVEPKKDWRGNRSTT